MADASGNADKLSLLKLDEVRTWKKFMHAGMASSLLMYRTKSCEMLHAGLPLCEAKMDVRRGKAAR